MMLLPIWAKSSSKYFLLLLAKEIAAASLNIEVTMRSPKPEDFPFNAFFFIQHLGIEQQSQQFKRMTASSSVDCAHNIQYTVFSHIDSFSQM